MQPYLTNPYQLSDYQIKYTSQQLQVFDQSNKLVDSFDMKYANDNPLGERFDQNRYIGAENAHFNRLVYANGHFYTLIKDTLFQVDLNCLSQIESIPGNKSSGFCKMCVFNNQIIVTNERQFFKLSNKFEETHFFFDDAEITPKNVVLYDFNNHSTICTQWNNRFMIFEIGAETANFCSVAQVLSPNSLVLVYKYSKLTGKMRNQWLTLHKTKFKSRTVSKNTVMKSKLVITLRNTEWKP